MKNKTLRIFSRIIGSILLLIILLLIAATVYVRVNKDKLLGIINTNINKNISGKFEMKGIDLSTLSHFPNIAVNLKDITLVDSVYHTPLLQCKLLSCRFNIFKLWAIKHQISKVVIEQGTVRMLTDSNGYSNTSMFRKKEKAPSSSSAQGSFIVHKVEMKNVNFRIDDAKKLKHYNIGLEKLTAAIQQQDSILQFNVDEKVIIHQLTFNELRGSYLENHRVEGKMKLHYNKAAKTLSCTETDLKINQQKYTVSALFRLSGQPNFHIDATTKKLLFSNGVALLTPKLRKTLENIQLQGPVEVHAVIDGLMKFRAIPLININLKTANNELSAGSVKLKDCSFKGTFVNQIADTLPRTDEFSRVVLQTFSGKLDGLQLQGKNIVATNLLKPVVQFDLKSNAALNELENLFAFENLKFLKGTAQMALLYNGPLLTDPALLKNLTVHLNIKDGAMQYLPKNVLLDNCSGDVTIGENKLLCKGFQFNLLHTHIKINITGSDIANFSNLEAGKADLAFSLYSPHLHFDELSNAFSGNEQQVQKKGKGKFVSTTNKINQVLNGVDFRVHIMADTLTKGAFFASNLDARLFFRKDSWQLENISMHHAGGTAKVSGSVVKNAQRGVRLTTDIQLQQINIQQLFRAFHNFGMQGVTAENLRGNLTATGHINTQLYKGKTSMATAGTRGYIDFSLKNGAIVNHKELEQVKVLFLKDRDMSNIRFAELKDKIQIYPRYVYLNRMEIQSTAVTLFVEGIYDFNKKNTDMLIQIPMSNMKKRDENYKAKNKGVNAKTGTSILIRAKNDDAGNISLSPTLSKKTKTQLDN